MTVADYANSDPAVVRSGRVKKAVANAIQQEGRLPTSLDTAAEAEPGALLVWFLQVVGHSPWMGLPSARSHSGFGEGAGWPGALAFCAAEMSAFACVVVPATCSLAFRLSLQFTRVLPVLCPLLFVEEP